jgi:hypothetical protein
VDPKAVIILIGLVLGVLIVVHAATREKKHEGDRPSDWPPEDQH